MLKWYLKQILKHLPFGLRIIRAGQRFNWPKPTLPKDEESFNRICANIIAGCEVALPMVDETNAWYTCKPRIWAHAAGARQILFANTKEAIDDSISHGFKVVEVDVSVTSDGIPVLSHGFKPNGIEMFKCIPTFKTFISSPICGEYTPLALSDLWNKYESWQGYFAIDQTPTSMRPRFDLIGFMRKYAPKSFLGKTIFLAYTLEELVALKGNNPFGAVHYCLYPLPPYQYLPLLVKTLAAANVHSVSFGEREIDEETKKVVQVFHDANIYVSVARVDTIERWLLWRNCGVKCINSNYLTPDDLDRVEVT